MNEMAAICDEVGANVDDVRLGVGADQRIGYRFLFPGIGYGGSCFPKDVKALVRTANEAGRPARILEAVEAVNEDQKRCLVDRVSTYFHGQIAGKRFAVWGLAFKPETDDVREAPALHIVRFLLDAGASVCAYDPKAAAAFTALIGAHPNLEFNEHYYDATQGCDALILCTEWAFFRNADLQRVRGMMKTPVLFDGRNIYRPLVLERLGFDYFSIGRAPVFGHSKALARQTN
jgi:UDPglucose 6-dehydrogenase